MKKSDMREEWVKRVKHFLNDPFLNKTDLQENSLINKK